jgi:hypothetical protein
MFKRQREAMRQFGMNPGPGMVGPGRMIRPGQAQGPNAGFGQPDIFMGVPQNGQPQIREFFGPGGARRFEMRWQGRLRDGFPMEPKPEDVPPPPPPPEIK